MTPIRFGTDDDSDELARAEIYGLLANVFIAPPSSELHAQFGTAVTQAPVPGAFLEASWGGLVAAARRIALDDIRDEYAALFEGTGKPEIFLYGSFWIAGTLNEKPLAELRRDLHALGLSRPDTVAETEDHIAAVCEVMRYLIAGDDVAVCNLASQRRFFDAHVRTWVEPMFAAIAAHPSADFYRAAALFARDFFAVETQAFDLMDA